MASLSNEELRRIVTVESADWQPEALVVAREELARRGELPLRGVSTSLDPPPAPQDKRRPYFAKGLPIVILVVILLKVILIFFRY